MSQRTALCWILIATVLSAAWGLSIARRSDAFLDFKAVYYGARCLISGHNPYNVSEVSAVFKAAGGEWPGESPVAIEVVTRNVNLPTTLVFVAPIAVLPFDLALSLWFTLAAVCLVIAAFLVWKTSSKREPEFSLLLIVFLLANCELVFKGGNTALLVVSLCIAAAWSIANSKLGFAGTVCLGICLALKPHDTGWVWLYFLLAGGIWRKRALQALGISATIGCAAFIWVWHVDPRWMSSWGSNMAAIASPGGLNEPGPFSLTGGSADMVINLQSAIAVLWNQPKIYNFVSYLICGAMLLIWALRTLKLQATRTTLWYGLAAVVAPTLLITYHRGYDTKLVLLMIPACAMLMSRRGVVRWIAPLSTLGTFIFTGDIALALQVLYRSHLPIGGSGLVQRGVSAVLLEPTPVLLLIMGVFYLWVYLNDAVIYAPEGENAPA